MQKVQNMNPIYYANLLTPSIFYIGFAILFFIKKREEDNSRLFLGITCLTMLISVIIRMTIIHLDIPIRPITVTTPSMLIVSIIVASIHLLYPIEAIRPGWLNWKRFFMLMMPSLLLMGFHIIQLKLGYKSAVYYSLLETLDHYPSFDSASRWVLAFLIFAPIIVFSLWIYSNKDKLITGKWLTKYMIAISCFYAGKGLIILFDNVTAYYISSNIGIVAILYISYIELFVRQRLPEMKPLASVENDKETFLSLQLDIYIEQNEPWRTPDITLDNIAKTLKTNRTTLSRIIHKKGFDNFTAYINKFRIEAYIDMVNNKTQPNLTKIFEEVGYRSKNTALRNFRAITGMNPSEYFKK